MDKIPYDTVMNEFENPWQTRGSREIYINPWIRVREDHVIRADGHDGIYGVVEFQNYALGIVPVTDNGDTFLVGQWRYPLGAYSWEIPEGGGPLAVPLLDSARRELAEETGLTASTWTDLGPFHLSNSVTDEAGQIFLAQDLTFGDARPDGDEVLSVRRLPLTEAYAMAMAGRITDGVSVIGLARAVHFLAHPTVHNNEP
jgi:8-oxo-dGTP pyrophosphatase MutT (NUDIX family)